jgi:hypothetical protein
MEVMTTWNGAESFKALMENDPWMGVALVHLLTNEQWNALASGAILRELAANIQRHARARSARGGAGDVVEDTASEVLIRLVTRESFVGFDPAKGTPKAFMAGVIHRYVRAVMRLRANRLVGIGCDSAISVSIEGREPTPEMAAAQHDVFEIARQEIERLPLMYCDAIRRKHPVLGLPLTPYDGNQDAENVRYSRALAKVRAAFDQMGIDG